jgi:hypothetical protein
VSQRIRSESKRSSGGRRQSGTSGGLDTRDRPAPAGPASLSARPTTCSEWAG